MNETLYRWTFNFHKVVRQHNSSAVENFILPYSAVYLRIQKWKNYWNRSTFVKVIVKIKVAQFFYSQCIKVKFVKKWRCYYIIVVVWNWTKFVTTRCVLWDLLHPNFVCGRGSAPDPAGGAYNAPPDPLAGEEGARCPLPKNPTPTLGPKASRFKLSPPNPKTKLHPWEVGNLPDQSKYGCYGPVLNHQCTMLDAYRAHA